MSKLRSEKAFLQDRRYSGAYQLFLTILIPSHGINESGEAQSSLKIKQRGRRHDQARSGTRSRLEGFSPLVNSMFLAAEIIHHEERLGQGKDWPGLLEWDIGACMQQLRATCLPRSWSEQKVVCCGKSSTFLISSTDLDMPVSWRRSRVDCTTDMSPRLDSFGLIIIGGEWTNSI